MSEVTKFNTDVYATERAEAAAAPRKHGGKMDEEELQEIMNGLISDAVQMVDGELSPRREKATDYYLAKPFGNEEDGRSQVIDSVVRDTVQSILPSLIRVFTGPERAVELVPRTLAGVQYAAQATDYCQYVFMEDNEGFLKIHDVLKDGLVRKLGVFKWYWDYESNQAYRDEGISYAQLQQLAARDDVTLNDIEECEPEEGSEADELNKEAEQKYESDMQAYQQAAAGAKQQAAQPPQPQQPGQPSQPQQPPPQLPPQPQKPTPQKAYNVDYTVKIEGKPCIVTVPPEEFLFNRTARDIETALMVAHRVEKSRGELLSMGIPEDVLDEWGQQDINLDVNQEAVARNLNFNINMGIDPEAGRANDKVLYIEAYPFLDLNGDGERELCKVCLIGPSYHVALPPEPVDERPFAAFCPIPEPHTMVGQSEADLTMDLQLSKSSVLRGTLDSLALSIYPRMGIVDGMVNVEDAMNTEIGALIRMRKEGSIYPITHPFTGKEALPLLEYFDTMSESRTQRSKGAMALDADALQSSTDEAVAAQVAQVQQGTELIARIFAEQCLKRVFKGIYKMLVKYRPAARLVRLRGNYVQINTQQWESDMDCIVNVALGTSDTNKKLAALAFQATKIEQLMAQLGPANPAGGLPMLIEVYRRIAELAGVKDIAAMWPQLPPNWQPPQQAPQPTPEMVLAQANIKIEQMKAQKDLAIKQAELKLKQQGQAFEQQMEIRKAANDFVLRRYAIDAQFKTNFTQMNLEADARSEEAELRGTLDIHDQLHEHAMDRANAAHGQAMDIAGAIADAAGSNQQDDAQGDDTAE